MTYLQGLKLELQNNKDAGYLKLKSDIAFCRQTLNKLYEDGKIDKKNYETLTKGLKNVTYLKQIIKYCNKLKGRI